MPTIINADTLIGGAIITGDTSGQLQLQALQAQIMALE